MKRRQPSPAVAADAPTVLITGWSVPEPLLAPWQTALSATSGQPVQLFDFHPVGASLGYCPPLGHLPSPYAQALRESWGLNPVHPRTLIGWSTGTLIALEASYFWPDHVAKLVLVGGTACFCRKNGYTCGTDATQVRWLAKQIKGAHASDALHDFLKRTLQPHAWPPDRAAAYAEAARAMGAAALAMGLAYLQQADWRAWCAGIQQPVELLHGGQDAVIPPAAAQWLQAALPHARLVIDAEQGHGWPLSDPTGLARRIADLQTDAGLAIG